MRRAGFTLVELLIVIGIIGILSAVVATAVVSGRKKAWQVECANRLEQFGLAIQTYKSDHGDDAYPLWLSALLDRQLRGVDEIYRCPRDPSGGTQGGRPDWITRESQYAETNDLAPADFSDPDKSSSVKGSLPAYKSDFSLGSRVTEDARNEKIAACSYLYEFTGEYCSWYDKDYYDLDGDGDTDEVVTDNYTWREVNRVAVEQTENTKRDLVPVIRCFWHVDPSLPGNREGYLRDADQPGKNVVVLRHGLSVGTTLPKQWDQ